MSLFSTYKQAIKSMPRCLVGVIDCEGVEAEAIRNAEPPMSILRDLVRIECDLIDEEQDSVVNYYTPREVAAVRRYLKQLGG